MKIRHFLLISTFLIHFSLSGFAQEKSFNPFFDLNGTWSFRIDPYNQGVEHKWFQVSQANVLAWDKLPVPGNWDLKNEYAHYVGLGWYQKTIEIPHNWSGKQVKIHFEAVSHDASVWINGQFLGKSNSGFLPFEFDITSFVQAGKSNQVTLLVDNSKKIGAIWNWGGIRRSVHLSASDRIRLTGNYITPIFDYKKNLAKVHFRLKFQNHSSQPTEVAGEIRVKKDHVLLKSIPFHKTISASTDSEITLITRLEGKEVSSWHFDSPNLYTTEIWINGSSNPLEVERFGLRKIELDPVKKQLLLNGEPIRAMGFNLVPDDRITGNTLPLWRIKEDIDLIKSAGGNMARLSHLPLPKAALDYLDERGILTFSEVPLWGFDPLADPESKTSKEWLERLIDTQYNHPSIIGWNVGNEIGDYPETFEYVRKSIAYAKTLDSTRLVTAVSHTAQRENDFLIHSDLGFINKYGSELRDITETQHNRLPGKILFYSEYGIAQFGEDLNSDFDAKSLIDPLRNLDYLIGASLWTFNDYRSNYFGTKEHSENRSWGIVDVYRRKKKAFFSIAKENSPVQNLTLSSTSNSTAEVILTPRGLLDIPSFTLRNYRLLWQIKDSQGKVLESAWENLPEISPGSQSLKRNMAWKSTDGQTLEVLLLTPQLDQVAAASIDFQAPKIVAPLAVFGGRMLQNDIRPNSASIRVFLDDNPTADFHLARVKVGEEIKETMPSYENFLDITGLNFSTPYDLEILAVNSSGVRQVWKQSVEIDPKQILPPAIRHIQRESNGFFIGYATEVDDFQFRVRFSSEKSALEGGKIITSVNPGLIFIPLERDDEVFYFQIQRVKDNFYHSEWSPVYSVSPDQDAFPETPVIQGVTLQKGHAMIHFSPVKKAIGYQLAYRETTQTNSPWKTQVISQSQAQFFSVEGLLPKAGYEFKISAISSQGRSKESSSTKALPSL